jgi:exosortase A-associated hydrolase 2
LTARLHPTFIGNSDARIFALLRRPAGDCGACVLIVPPFAEEMNKSRRIATDFARAAASRGLAALSVDLYGTGDSDGEFEEGTWDGWKADLRGAIAWAAHEGCKVTTLLGIRLGCALAAEVARDSDLGIECSVFWQPVLDGSRMFDQFLRLRVAAAMMEHDRKESTADLRAKLRAGESLEIAGYFVSAELAAQLDGVHLAESMGPHLGALQWFEVVRSADSPPPVPAVKAVDAARAQGLNVHLHTVPGEPFWSSTEIVTNSALVEQSAALLPVRRDAGNQAAVGGA